jgi:disulfide bond formation protein DsbB
MPYETVRTFLAILALGANVATLVIVVAALAKGTFRDRVFGALAGSELWFGFVVAATAMLGSLYLSEIAHLVPCVFCWYQRIAMYPIAIILLIAAVRRDHGIRIYAGVLAAIGAAIAAYHRLLQIFPELDSGTCGTGVPCTAAWFEIFGFITIPYMALSAFLLILALLWVDRFNSPENAPSSNAAADE